MEFCEVIEDLKCIDIREVAKDFNRKGRFVDCCCVWDTIYTVLYIKREAIIFPTALPIVKYLENIVNFNQWIIEGMNPYVTYSDSDSDYIFRS